MEYWRKGWVSFLVCAFCFLYLLKFSWLKWGDLIVDVGREMYVPLELSSGKLLYRDIFYLYGPFSPYFNAILFKILGVHIHSLIISGIITIVAVSILIYKISRLFLNILFSTFAVLTFLFVFAFGQYVYFGNYNFILPYSYPSIHGIMFSLAALYLFYCSFFKAARYKYLCIMFVVLVSLCRIEIGLALILSIMLTIIFYSLSRRENFKRALYHLSTYVILPFIFTVAIYGLFLISALDIMRKSNSLDIWFKVINIDIPFNRWLSGTGDILGNIQIIFKVSLYYLFFCIFFSIGGFAIAYLYRFKTKLKRYIFSLLIGSVFFGIVFISFKKIFTYDLQYRCLPLICLITILISLWKFTKQKEKAEYLFLVTISLFSLFMVSRMLFSAWAGHYGFYILTPGMVVYYIFFLKIIAEALNSTAARRFFSLGFLFIFILFITSHFDISRLCYQNKTLKISSPRGTLYAFNNDRENRCKELIEFLRQNTDKKESLVIFPEGLTVNFLSERENPLYYYSYLPHELAQAKMIESIISDMENKKVDYVVLTQRDTAEYGYPIFGKDYGERLWNYISENYILYKQFGPFPFTSQDYGIVLFRRKA